MAEDFANVLDEMLKELEGNQEVQGLLKELESQVLDGNASWRKHFTDRELGLIETCCTYAVNEPAGLPGHNLMIIVSKLRFLVDAAEFLLRVLTSED